MAFAAPNAPELPENFKLCLASARLPHPPHPPLLSALVGHPIQAGLAGRFRIMASLLLSLLQIDNTVIIMIFGGICQNKYIT